MKDCALKLAVGMITAQAKRSVDINEGLTSSTD
jgi:hypothetical protein